MFVTIPPSAGGFPYPPSGHTMRLLALITAAVAYLNYSQVDPRGRVVDIPISQLQSSYDFIIIGGGSAGGVVANRLTEISNWTVLLIEAGGDETAQTDVPLLARDLYYTQFDWNYTTVPQAAACGSLGGRCVWPTGRVLGGTGVLSDNMYVRGNMRDYDNWAAMGNPGWSYQEVLPYFRLSEDNETPKYRNDTRYHGVGGYLTVSIAPFLTPLAPVFTTAGEQMGYPNVDYNAASQTGFMIPQATLRNGTRCSSAKAFLRPIRYRPNFSVTYYSQVTKILIGESNKTAYGVQFVRNNVSYTVYSNMEVILSAGSINSPQLLMLSGVGPASELQKFNIPLIKNAPVGQRLLDHVSLPLFFKINQTVTITRSVYENVSAVIAYAGHGMGPLTSPLATETIGFLNSKFNDAGLDYPDVQFLMCSGVPNHYNEEQLWFVVPLFLHPLSAGNVTLQSSSPFSPPLINPNYLSVPSDYARSLEAAKLAYNISMTPALQAYGSQLYRPYYPNCNNLTMLSESWWSCMMYQYGTTVFHSSGSCKMGPSNDTMSVVDNHLRVYGVNKLRVIDGSIIPQIVSGNSNAAIVMIGERGSAWIMQDYNVTAPAMYQPTMTM